LVKPRITCFMIVRNALSQGYSFVEVVAQALPVCDEILVGDGGRRGAYGGDTSGS